MSGCCATGYERFFGPRLARRDARRYRKRGLDDTAQRLVDELSAHGASGTSLEIGGGVGAIELELLKRGVERATIVARRASRSTIRPFPSSPHCPPMTTVAGMTAPI